MGSLISVNVGFQEYIATSVGGTSARTETYLIYHLPE